MKCQVCGTESDFDAAFIKERQAWRFSHRMVCPSCWVRRDKTHGSRFIWIVLIVGVCGFILTWQAPEMLLGRLFLNAFLIGFFVVFSILPHELGHALAARAVGWHVHQIVIGVGKPLFKRRWFGILFDVRTIPIAGATWMTPQDMRWFRLKRFLAVLAGPLVNLAMAFTVGIVCDPKLWNFDFHSSPTPARFFIWANIWVALANLWPHQPKSGFGVASDGKQLLQTISITPDGIRQLQALRFAYEAMICMEQSDHSGMRTWCDKGLALYPDDSHLLNLSGINHLNEQNYEAAREVFLKQLRKEDQSTALHFMLLNNLAYADALSENPALLAEADAYSKYAFAALPWSPAIVGTRGTVLVAMGNYDEGMKLLQKSMEDADSARSKAENACHMVVALARTNRCDEARKHLQLARQLDSKCILLTRAEQAIARCVD